MKNNMIVHSIKTFLFLTVFILSTLSINAQTVEVVTGDFITPYILAHGQVTNDNLYPSGHFETSDFQTEFTFSGPDHWYNDDNEVAWEGDFYLRSGSASPFSTRSAFLSLTVPANHNATFTFAYFSEGNGPGKFFFINNVQEFSIGEVDDWTVYEKVLGPGTYNFEWRLSVGYGSAGEIFYIDEVELNITQNHVVRIEDGNEALGKVLSSDEFGNATWRDNRVVNTNPVDSSGIKIINESDDTNCQYQSFMSDGTGLFIMNAASVGVETRCTDIGYKSTNINTGFIANEGLVGYYSDNMSNSGFMSKNSTNVGFHSSLSLNANYFSAGSKIGYQAQSGLTGFESTGALEIGFLAKNAVDTNFVSVGSKYGFFARKPILGGFAVFEAGYDSFSSFNSLRDGYYSKFAGRYGFYSYGSTSASFRSRSGLSYGLYITDSDIAGIRVATPDSGVAGDFTGDVDVSGNLSKGGGSFKIDHPLDPENKFLYHSFVESPDMMNVYNGNITTDENGVAEVALPDWFETLNSEYRYQLTVIGTFAQAIIKSELEGNQFVIQTDIPHVKVSWQITGIRQDPYAMKNRIPVEEDKDDEYKGHYLHPKAYDMPFEKGIDFVKQEKYNKIENQEEEIRN